MPAFSRVRALAQLRSAAAVTLPQHLPPRSDAETDDLRAVLAQAYRDDARAYPHAAPAPDLDAAAWGLEAFLVVAHRWYVGQDATPLPPAPPEPSDAAAAAAHHLSADLALRYLATAPGLWGAGTTASLRARGFAAAADGPRVKTYWPAVDEPARLSGYTVERRLPGGEWTTLADVTPDVIDGAVASYWDEAPVFGLNHYRLRSRLTDGTYRLSAERSVDFVIDDAAVRVFPNPATFAYTVYVPRATAHAVEICLVNALGQVLETRRSEDGAEEYFTFGVGVPAGAYLVDVRVGGLRRVVPLVVGG